MFEQCFHMVHLYEMVAPAEQNHISRNLQRKQSSQLRSPEMLHKEKKKLRIPCFTIKIEVFVRSITDTKPK